MKTSENFESLKLRIAGLCAGSEQCEADIRKKLAATSLSRQETDDLISFLQQQNFINENRFAKAFSRDKVRFSGWGKAKIKAALQMKRISSRAISEGIGSIDNNDYLEAIKRAGKAKARNLNLSSPKDTAKFIRHLHSRGFESSLIFQLLEAMRISRDL